MKTLLMLPMMLLLSVVGCDPESYDPNMDYGLDGQWNLTHVSGGLAGVNKSFEPGLIVWTFNEHTGMVTIVNNSDDGFSMLESGNYSFLIENEGDYKTISIDGMILGNIDISPTNIMIDQRISDGFLLELTK